MKRKILFCMIGTNPQIVTETVWALKQQDPMPWIPTHIHVVTTSFSLAKIRTALHDIDGPLARLFFNFPPETFIHVPTRNGKSITIAPGRPVETKADLLKDVNTEKEAALMGDLIYRLMVEFTNDPDSEVHVSVAGGRKTMSAHALLAMTLAGRARDRASHVLVREEFEAHPEFWHPDQGGLLNRREELRIKPRPAPTLDPKTAEIVLVPTPTPLMRYRLGKVVQSVKMSLNEVIAQQNLAIMLETEPKLVLDTSANTVIACGVSRRLTLRNFAIYRLLATACHMGWHGVGPDGDGPRHKGWLSVPQICVGFVGNQLLGKLLVDYLEQACRSMPSQREPKNVESVRAWEEVLGIQDPDERLLRSQLALASNTRLKNELRKHFGDVALSFIGPSEIATRGNRKVSERGKILTAGAARFGLTLPPEAIQIR